MSSVFSRLELNAGLVTDQLKDNSVPVQKQMEKMPSLLPEWAMTDMKNGSVGGYYQNPVATVSTNIQYYAQNITNVAGADQTSNTVNVFNAANTLYHAVPAYIAHTNRISGVTEPNQNTLLLPHLDTAINNGKILCTLMYQTDGVQNNAPMIGSFTSLYTANNFANLANIIITFAGEIQNTINVIVTTPEGGGEPTTTYTSNLSSSRSTTMISILNQVNNEMYNRRVNDENFYTKGQQIIAEYGQLKKFNRLGATETDMFTNLVGTDKLKERLNS